MKTLTNFLTANQSAEVVLDLNQLNALKGGDGDGGYIIEKDPPIYIKE
ncbi:MAG: hypothetical protein JW783_02490 [Bacteroidales bacterium]|nr:hypothetical protein [Bacteroidales bacterium]MBN2748170.1 hypothetical protein [Bacteroidales bacterium]